MRTFTSLLAAALTAAAISVPALPATAAGGGDTPPTELVGKGTAIPLNNKAMILDSKWGPVYSAGQQNSQLTVTVSGTDSITFRDKGIAGWKPGRDYFPRHCKKQRVKIGIKATCTILPRFRGSMFVQVWPRLGDDRIDGSTLPSWVRFWVLGDKGSDTVLLGAGNDFFNGYTGNDTVYGGDGNDWIRTGLDDDTVYGDAGDDEIIAGEGADHLYGGIGTDKLGGGPGDDIVSGDEGPDNLICSDGYDTTDQDSADAKRDHCEAYLP